MKTVSAIAAVVGVAAATSWNDFPSFKTPQNNDNQCDTQQSSGWDWGNLNSGSFSSYDSFGFSGWTCANSFGKRDPLTKRDFQAKCIQGSMSSGSGPSFNCGSSKDFSIDTYQISVSKDTDVEFHYQMPDGTTCKHTTSCKTGGTVVKNSQCGGAQQVSFQLPQGSSGGCDIGIHSIGFDCTGPPPSSSSAPAAPPSTSKPAVPSSSAPAAPVSSKPASPSSSAPAPPRSSQPAPPPSSSAPAPPRSSAPAPPSSSAPAPPSSSAPAPPPSSAPAPPASSAPAPPPSSSAPAPPPSSSAPAPPPSSSAPAAPPSSSAPPRYGSSSAPAPPPSSQPAPPSSSAPAAPPSSQPAPPPSSSAPAPPPSSSKPAEVSSSTPASPVTTSSSSSAPPSAPSAPCPDVLPQCLNTWIQSSGCKDNSDHDCFCKNSDFTKNVIDCVTAYGVDTSTISQALSYLQGICAVYIPQNPGLITNCPSSIPVTPPPAASTPPSSAAYVDTTTYTTERVTETVSTCKPGETITENGMPTVISTSRISTITITQTATFTTCNKCNGGGSPQTAPAVPKYTIISIANTYTVPCTYSEGVSQGFPIPSSSTITQLTTAVTVPLVQFTTAAPVAGATTYSVGLAEGAAPATSSAGAAAPGGYGAASTTFKPTASKPTTSSSNAPAMQTVNAAPAFGVSRLLGVAAGAVIAALAL